MSQQGKRQAWFRSVGSSTEAYEGDIWAAAKARGLTFEDTNGALLALANSELSASYTNVNDALQAWAEATGAYNWSSAGDLTVAQPSNATAFNGTDQYLHWSTGIGAVDGPEGTFAAWIKMNGGDGVRQRLFSEQLTNSGGDSRLALVRQADDTITMQLRLGATTRVQYESTWTLTVADGWTAIMFDWVSNGTLNAYKGDLEGHTVTTNTAGNITYTSNFWALAALANGGDPANACYSNVIFDTNRVGLETESVRRRFITASGGAVPQAADGSTLMGAAAVLCLTEETATFNQNGGTGPDATVQGGPLSACADQPPT